LSNNSTLYDGNNERWPTHSSSEGIKFFGTKKAHTQKTKTENVFPLSPHTAESTNQNISEISHECGLCFVTNRREQLVVVVVALFGVAEKGSQQKQQ
jgi:hypothetical protein